MTTNTYPIYRPYEEATSPKSTILRRSLLWVVWALFWPLRFMLRCINKLFILGPWQKTNKLRQHLNSLGFTDDAYTELANLTTVRDLRYRKLAAWNLALWHADQYTKQDAQRCLEFLEIVFRYEHLPNKLSRALVLQAESVKLLNGNTKQAAKAILDHIHQYGYDSNLYLALASIASSKKYQLECINKALVPSNVAPLKLKPGKGHPYDRLTATAKKTGALDAAKQPRVTVIIPAYNAAKTIHTALESMINQTWQNLEIIVANDSSTDGTKTIVEKFSKKDARIKLVTTPVNSGPYVARNMALKIATGEFITCNDSDDWSHPEKIERQVEHLMKNPDIVANASELSRAYDDVSFYRRGLPGQYIQVNMSSLMFRKKPVMEKLGFWDSVRFGADSEFIKRLCRAFGDNSVVFMKNSLYSFLRQSDDSLTGNKAFGYHGFLMGARLEYASSQKHFYDNTSSLYYDFPMKQRPFAVPYPMLPRRAKSMGGRQLDTIIAADFCKPTKQLASLIKLIERTQQQNKRLGVVQLYTYSSHDTTMSPVIRTLINGDSVQALVYGETLQSDELIIYDAASLTKKQTYLPQISAQTCRLQNYSETAKEVVQKYFSADNWQPL